MPVSVPVEGRRLAWGGFWLGFALGGFFDGIILHQMLQWHHLLSAVAPDGTVADLRFQVLADGVFHLAHYVFAAIGLWLLWAGRSAIGLAGADWRMVGFALLGFGAWHTVDAVLVHWVLGLHRIRMDTEMKLLWDLAWLVPFGLGVAALGAWLLRHPPARGGGRPAVAGLVLAVLASGPVAALPPGDGDGMALVVFRPGMTDDAIIAAAGAVDGRLVWSDASGGVWLIAVEEGAGRLYRHGALMVSAGPIGAGCLSWARIGEG